MEPFTVIEGTKRERVLYKPKREHYLKAIVRHLGNHLDLYESHSLLELMPRPEGKQFLYLNVMLLGKLTDKELEGNALDALEVFFFRTELVMQMIGALTPRQLMQMFPVTKDYDGHKYGCKDYFFTMERIRKHGEDTEIGADNAPDFLMDYENPWINLLMVHLMMMIGRMRVLQGGREPMEEFLESQGVDSYHFYEREGIMVNSRTGEVTKVEPPKTRVPKYMEVLEGRAD